MSTTFKAIAIFIAVMLTRNTIVILNYFLVPSPDIGDPLSSSGFTQRVPAGQCNVLTNMTIGHWKTRQLTSEENNLIFQFLKRVRIDYNFPPNYQRSDGLCGNISTMEPGAPGQYRAVCDPEGVTPCCFNYRCVYKSVEECKCENCLDIRNMKHAEYSSWIPSNPACVYDTHSPQRACQILKGLNIAFVGDSFVRNLYTALLLVVTGNKEDGAMKSDVDSVLRELCSGKYMFLGKSCRTLLNNDVQVCNGTVNLKRFFFYNEHFWTKFKAKMSGQKLSLLVMGSGIHHNYSVPLAVSSFVKPMMKYISNGQERRPALLWTGPHAPGVMQSPTYIHQTYHCARAFNINITSALQPFGIPVFDTFNLTDGMASIDGQHYGIGINLVKANILLKYIEQARKEDGW